ncbi:MAG: formimidoylglutamase [Gammaproteobacteria bacterium]|nr:formimidoylglutamase [Gammaproteobacteria bacterium]
MNWESRYIPPDPVFWQGRADLPSDSCFYQHVKLLNLLTGTLEKTAPITFAILGFKCDEGVQRDLGRTGAFEAPVAIRQRLARLPIQTPAIHCYDAGNIICTDHDLEESQASLATIVALLLSKHIRPIVIGGGHEVAWGHYQGIARFLSPQKRLGIINFDAHFDMQPTHPYHRGGSATAFYQVAEAHKTEQRHFDYNCIGIQHAGNIRQAFDIAKKYNTKIILADEMHQGLQEKCFDFVDRVADENDYIYTSLSLDVFASPFAPGVGTIQPLGLYPWHVIPLLRQTAASGKVISYDIAEHVPRYDIDHRTAKLAATLIYEIIHHHNEPEKY